MMLTPRTYPKYAADQDIEMAVYKNCQATFFLAVGASDSAIKKPLVSF